MDFHILYERGLLSLSPSLSPSFFLSFSRLGILIKMKREKERGSAGTCGKLQGDKSPSLRHGAHLAFPESARVENFPGVNFRSNFRRIAIENLRDANRRQTHEPFELALASVFFLLTALVIPLNTLYFTFVYEYYTCQIALYILSQLCICTAALQTHRFSRRIIFEKSE